MTPERHMWLPVGIMENPMGIRHVPLVLPGLFVEAFELVEALEELF